MSREMSVWLLFWPETCPLLFAFASTLDRPRYYAPAVDDLPPSTTTDQGLLWFAVPKGRVCAMQ